MEIIPAIDLRGGNVVRLLRGEYDQETIYFTDPAGTAKTWEADGAARIHIVDLEGARDGTMQNQQALKEIRESIRIPMQLGGGLRDMSSVDRILSGLNIERAILGSVLLQKPELAEEASKKYPGRIILGIDARNGFMATQGWRETSTVKATDLVKDFQGLDIAEVIYTDIARDGTLEGPNYKAQAEMAQISPFPVIASGGVGNLDHIVELSKLSKREEGKNITGVIVGKALYDQKFSLRDAIAAAG